MTMPLLTLVPSGRMIPFLDVHIGAPFWAHSKVWIRTDYAAATELGSAERFNHKSTCNFTIDECDKIVEAVDYFVGGVPQ